MYKKVAEHGIMHIWQVIAKGFLKVKKFRLFSYQSQIDGILYIWSEILGGGECFLRHSMT